MAGDVTDNVAAGGHVTLIGVTGVDIDDTMEQVGLAMLTPEVLCCLCNPQLVFPASKAGMGVRHKVQVQVQVQFEV